MVFAFVATILPVTAEEPHWDYAQHGGAEAWGELTTEDGAPAYPDCNAAEQSPVDIPAVALFNESLRVDHAPGPFEVVNNGHTIQVNVEPGSSMTVDGKTYDLLQFHFHSPSEHEIAGEQTVLAAHFVHRAADGEYAVLGAMIVPGNANDTFGTVLAAMPKEEGKAESDTSITLADLLPADLAHWAYDGSFTTPPCTERVQWYVLAEPVTVSLQQAAEFRSLAFLHHEGEYVGNARPVQPLNGRHGSPESDAPVITPPSTGSAGLAEAHP